MGPINKREAERVEDDNSYMRSDKNFDPMKLQEYDFDTFVVEEKQDIWEDQDEEWNPSLAEEKQIQKAKTNNKKISSRRATRRRKARRPCGLQKQKRRFLLKLRMSNKKKTKDSHLQTKANNTLTKKRKDGGSKARPKKGKKTSSNTRKPCKKVMGWNGVFARSALDGTRKYFILVSIRGQKLYEGSFQTEEECAKAYDDLIVRERGLAGQKLNFPERYMAAPAKRTF